MMWPSTSIACGMYMSPPSARPSAFGDDRLAVPGRPVEEHRLAGVDRRAELLEHVVADDQVREALRAAARDRCSRAPPPARASARRSAASGTGAGPTYWLTSRYCRARSRPRVGQRVAIAGRARCRPRRAPRSAARRAARSMSGSSIANGSRIRSASDEAGRLAAVQRLDQQLLDLIRAQAGVLRASSAPAAPAPCSGSRSSSEGGGCSAHWLRHRHEDLDELDRPPDRSSRPRSPGRCRTRAGTPSSRRSWPPLLRRAGAAWCGASRSARAATARRSCRTCRSAPASRRATTMSSTPVRSARLRSASTRALPARSSRLISRSSSDRSGCAKASSSPTR